MVRRAELQTARVLQTGCRWRGPGEGTDAREVRLPAPLGEDQDEPQDATAFPRLSGCVCVDVCDGCRNLSQRPSRESASLQTMDQPGACMTAFADRFKCEDCGAKMPVPLLPCSCGSRHFVNPEGQRIEQLA